jgi:hypothetical protein
MFSARSDVLGDEYLKADPEHFGGASLGPVDPLEEAKELSTAAAGRPASTAVVQVQANRGCLFRWEGAVQIFP